MQNNSSTKNFAVIGFGKLGLLHAALINGIPGSRLVAVVDNSSVMLEMLKAQFPGVQVFTSHRDLLEKVKLDGAFICTPTHLHVEIAKDCIERGVPVFIEKPLCAHLSDARPLLDLLSRKNVPTMVGHMRRYMETFHHAKSIITSGALGRLQGFKSTMYIGQLFKPGKGWRYEKKISGGGVLVTQNSHLVDMLMWYFGDVEWVSGHTRQMYSKEVEDAVHAYFGFKQGLKGWMDCSWSERHHRTLTMEIRVEAENGNLVVNDDEVQLYLIEGNKDYKTGWSHWKKPDLYRGVSIDIGGPYYTLQTEDFIKSLNSNYRVDSDVHFGYKVQEVLESIYSSAEENGRPVMIGGAL